MSNRSINGNGLVWKTRCFGEPASERLEADLAAEVAARLDAVAEIFVVAVAVVFAGRPFAFASLAFALFASAASAQSPERQWSVETPKEADAALRFATPDTDDQPIAFHCARGSGQVRVGAELAKRLAVRQAGGVWVDKAGVRAPWPMSVNLTTDGASLTANIALVRANARLGAAVAAHLALQV